MEDRNLALELVRVTEAAALSCARWMGRGDAKGADQAAVDAMRRAFDGVRIRGTVVIGEGERDEAPMLYIGEKVGAGWPGHVDSHGGDNEEFAPRVDIAVDPLEGTNLCATGSPGALAVIAIAEDGKFLNAPDTYMDKIAVGPAGKGVIDITKSPTWNLNALAEAKRSKVEELTPSSWSAIAISRSSPRCARQARASASSPTATCRRRSPRARTSPASTSCSASAARPKACSRRRRCAASAATCRASSSIATTTSGRAPRRWASRITTRSIASTSWRRATSCSPATGVTEGSFLKGVRFFANGATTQSIVMRSQSGTVRIVDAEHDFARKPNFGWLTNKT